MSWINIDYTDKEQDFLSHPNGNYSTFSIVEIEEEKYWVKKYSDPWGQKKKVINRFRTLSYDGCNAFPVGSLYIQGEDSGYLSKYFEDAIDFSSDSCSSIPYNIRYQSALDVNSQLKFLHQNGFIVNDIRNENSLLSLSYQHGIMIDFEDMILEDNFIYKNGYYYFEKPGTIIDFPPSKWEDVKKQFISNTSLLYGKDLEVLFLDCGLNSLLAVFSFDNEIFEFANQLFKDDKVIYFDEIASKFQDEERVKYYAKSLAENK